MWQLQGCMLVLFRKPALIMMFWTLQAGVHHRVVCIRKNGYCPSGRGTERDGDIEGELLLLGECSPDIRWTLSLCILIPRLSRLFLVPHWESHPKCVSWVLTDAFYESEECKCVGIFKRSSGLQTSAIVILSSLPAKTNTSIVACPFALGSSLAGSSRPALC